MKNMVLGKTHFNQSNIDSPLAFYFKLEWSIYHKPVSNLFTSFSKAMYSKTGMFHNVNVLIPYRVTPTKK
jgi:hypothetical protein